MVVGQDQAVGAEDHARARPAPAFASIVIDTTLGSTAAATCDSGSVGSLRGCVAAWAAGDVEAATSWVPVVVVEVHGQERTAGAAPSHEAGGGRHGQARRPRREGRAAGPTSATDAGAGRGRRGGAWEAPPSRRRRLRGPVGRGSRTERRGTSMDRKGRRRPRCHPAVQAAETAQRAPMTAAR